MSRCRLLRRGLGVRYHSRRGARHLHLLRPRHMVRLHRRGHLRRRQLGRRHLRRRHGRRDHGVLRHPGCLLEVRDVVLLLLLLCGGRGHLHLLRVLLLHRVQLLLLREVLLLRGLHRLLLCRELLLRRLHRLLLLLRRERLLLLQGLAMCV